MTAFDEFDRRAMHRALELALRGLETTDPNPRVGCVIARTGEIVGEGWHARAGGPHAEIHALEAAGARARDATAYVTLEPCDHHGRTPPCTSALIAAGVRRVIYAASDPNPRVDGAGAARLRAAGVHVESGLCREAAEAQNPGFRMRMRAGRPWVRLKLAASLDGRTALPAGESRWITGEAARADVHAFRARSSAILTGIGTLLRDDPQLTVRREAPAVERPPLRIVLDAALRVPAGARIFDGAGGVLVFTSVDEPARAALLEARGARVERLPAAADGVDLAQLMSRLAALELNELWVECGPTLAASLLARDFVDEWVLYLAPKLLGRDARPLVDLPAPASMAAARGFGIVDVTRIGEDVRLTLDPRRR